MSVTLRSRLPGIVAELQPKVSAAVKKTAEAIAEEARQRVPVDEGDLRDAIHVQRTGPAAYAVVAGNGGDVFYGHMVEMGTTHSAPQPFLLPAAEAHLDDAVARVEAALRSL